MGYPKDIRIIETFVGMPMRDRREMSKAAGTAGFFAADLASADRERYQKGGPA